MVAGLPVGCCFEPTKTELVGYFLKAKLSGQPLPPYYPQFLDFDVYSDHPFNILASTKELRNVQDEDFDGMEEGYFFSRLKKATPKGKRITRCIEGHGTWLEKSKTKKVYDETMKVIGVEKYFKFKPVAAGSHNMMAQNDQEWKMHEYSLPGYNDIVLCHITKKKDSSQDDDTAFRSSKRSRNYAVMESDYEASTSKRGRTGYGSSEGISGIMNPAHHNLQQTSDDDVEDAQNPMPRGSDHGIEDDTSDKALTEEIEGLISYDDPQVAQLQGAYDEQGRIANVEYVSSEFVNTNEQARDHGLEDNTTTDPHEYDEHATTAEINEQGTTATEPGLSCNDQQGTTIVNYSSSEYAIDDTQDPQKDDQIIQEEQAVPVASSARDNSTGYYDYANLIGPHHFMFEYDTPDFIWLAALAAT